MYDIFPLPISLFLGNAFCSSTFGGVHEKYAFAMFATAKSLENNSLLICDWHRCKSATTKAAS